MIDTLLRTALPVAGRGIIFAGHGVATSFVNRTTEEVHITLDALRSVITVLKELDYDFLTMDQLVSLSANGFRHPKHWTHLTFDDGYQNIFDIAYPFLKARGIPFSVFVSTHYIQTGDRFPTFWLRLAEQLGLPLQQMFPHLSLGERPAANLFQNGLRFASFAEHERIVGTVKSAVLAKHGGAILDRYYNDRPISIEDLVALASDPLVHVGSHSHHHIIYHDGQDRDVAKSNIDESIRLLREEWKVSKRPTFCYPNGDWAPQWAQLLADAGVPHAFPNATGFVDSTVEPQLMPRFWLSNPRRARATAAMSLVGNKMLYVFGRKPPPRLVGRS